MDLDQIRLASRRLFRAMILVVTFVVSLFLAVDVDNFNRVFDIVSPVYAVLVLAFLITSARKKKDESENPGRVFALKKKPKMDNMSWKQRLVGTWAKIERKGLYEYMLFNGAPSIMAYAQRDSDFGQIIENKSGDENTLRATSTGFPSAQSPWVHIPSSREEAVGVDGKDPAGYAVVVRMYWDEGEKKLISEIRNEKKKMTAYMHRSVDDNDIFHLTCTAVKDVDNSSAAFDCTFRRVS